MKKCIFIIAFSVLSNISNDGFFDVAKADEIQAPISNEQAFIIYRDKVRDLLVRSFKEKILIHGGIDQSIVIADSVFRERFMFVGTVKDIQTVNGEFSFLLERTDGSTEWKKFSLEANPGKIWRQSRLPGGHFYIVQPEEELLPSSSTKTVDIEKLKKYTGHRRFVAEVKHIIGSYNREYDAGYISQIWGEKNHLYFRLIAHFVELVVFNTQNTKAVFVFRLPEHAEIEQP